MFHGSLYMDDLKKKKGLEALNDRHSPKALDHRGLNISVRLSVPAKGQNTAETSDRAVTHFKLYQIFLPFPLNVDRM